MHKISTFAMIGALFGSALLVGASNSYAQDHSAPAGSALAQTPPVDQKAKQFKALPADQKNMYVKQAEAAKAPKTN